MREFKDGDTIVLEPFRAKAFPVLKDLMVDRSALDRIMHAGGFISVGTGSQIDGNSILIRKEDADRSMDSASCIGCGACAAACPNAAPMLFAAAKIAHLGLLPQGKPEWRERVLNMVAAMDKEGFGYCTNATECSEVCPKRVPFEVIAMMNRQYLGASVMRRK
jgi:succinate dehydrogenase / fumarate reductase iron-sulfur subunit